MTTDDIMRATTTDALSDLLAEYCDRHGLPFVSADELLLEIMARMGALDAQWKWVQAFISQWETVQAEEDFESAIRARGVTP